MRSADARHAAYHAATSLNRDDTPTFRHAMQKRSQPADACRGTSNAARRDGLLTISRRWAAILLLGRFSRMPWLISADCATPPPCRLLHAGSQDDVPRKRFSLVSMRDRFTLPLGSLLGGESSYTRCQRIPRTSRVISWARYFTRHRSLTFNFRLSFAFALCTARATARLLLRTLSRLGASARGFIAPAQGPFTVDG